MKVNNISWPVGFDKGDKIAKLYGVNFGAGMIFIDAEGIVKSTFLGGFGEKELENEVMNII